MQTHKTNVSRIQRDGRSRGGSSPNPRPRLGQPGEARWLISIFPHGQGCDQNPRAQGPRHLRGSRPVTGRESRPHEAQRWVGH